MKRVIVGILLAAALTGAGYGGWRVWKDKHPTKTDTNQQTQTKPSEDTYLVIKEWGVRMKLEDGIKDAKYEYHNNNGVYLSTNSIEKVSDCQNGKILALSRAKKGEHFGAVLVDDSFINGGAELIKIGEYYYIIEGPGYSCADHNSPEAVKALRTVKDELTNAVRTLEKVPSM